MSKKQLIKDKFKDREVDQKQTEMDKIPIEKHFEWVIKSHGESMPKIEWKTNYSNGSIKRFYNMSSLLYKSMPDMVDGNTVVFKIYDIKLRKEVNYAALFCEKLSSIPEKIIDTVYKDSIIGNTIIRYYSVSSSLISCDGEYRSRLNIYKSFLVAKRDYAEIWNEIEQYVILIKSRRDWNIYANYFHGSDSVDNSELERVIKFNSIAQIMLALSWFHIIYNEYINMTESHMNSIFKEIFLSHFEFDKDFIVELIKKYGKEDVGKFRITTSYLKHDIFGSKISRYIPLGYKMIPLNLREIQNPLKLNFKPWREFLIANKCNDLFANNIAPGFPIIMDWVLIKNTNKGLFDNTSQYERLKNSELATNILNLLYEAQRNTYFATSDLGKAKRKPEDNVKQWISNKFKKLSDKIEDPIEYSTEEIIMTDMTLLYPSENVGRTFADTIKLIQSSPEYDKKLGNMLVNYDIFAKYIFEICYNLLALNTKLGVIHGDFHLNNATIGYLYNISDQTKSDDSVVYICGKDETKYVFPNNGYFACIIDFSRALVNAETYENLINEGMPKSFKIIDDYDKFAAAETHNLLSWYLQLFPNKSAKKEKLLAIFKTQFNAVFKLLTCIDLYMFSLRLSVLMKQQKHVNKKCFDLIEKINKLSEVYIATEMNMLIEDENVAEEILNNDWPIETIITKCFPEYSEKIDKNITISDCYNLNNTFKYSLSKYELFPEMLKVAKYVDKNKDVEIDIMTRRRRDTREIHEKRRLYYLEHLKFLSKSYGDQYLN